MTFKYNNVYINETSTVVGPYEKEGPFGNLFDRTYDDLYMGAKTWEQAETKLISDSVDILLKKINKDAKAIDVHIGGDLLNQIIANNFAAKQFKIPYLGIYNACATSAEALIIAANMIEAKQIKSCLCTTSSHNNAAEKQFRFPVEYGGPKHKTATFTTTGAASAYLSNNKKGIKIESGTIGRVEDLEVKDLYHMGAVMAPAAASTLYQHLQDTKRNSDYYDLILTGDLGEYGKQIFLEYMETEYGIKLNNYNDTATMIYKLGEQPVYAGGSGPACAPLVTYSFIFKKMAGKELKKVLLIATGALHSVAIVNEGLSIPSIAHAVSLEVSA